MTQITYAAATNTAITLTGTSLASSAVTAFGGRQSAAVDNSTNRYIDAMVRFRTKGQAGGTGLVYLWLAAAPEATSPTYPDGCTGSDAAFTAPTNGTNMALLGTIQLSTTTAVVPRPMSVTQANGGIMPQKWVVVVQNASGAALSATAGDHVLEYQGVT